MRDKNPALIRLVTSRYREMQGLRTIGDAGLLLVGAAMFAVGIWADGHLSRPVLASGGALTLFVLYVFLWPTRLTKRVERHYDERFGRVSTSEDVTAPWIIFSMMGLGWAAVLDAHVSSLLSIATIVLIVAVRPAWIAWRDFPYRVHWGLVAVAGLVAALQLPMASERFFWRVTASFEVGLAAAIAGLCDHLLLARTLRGLPREDAAASEEPAQ